MPFEDIIREIELIRSRINHHPAYYSKIHDRARNWLVKESNRHSLAIEDINSFNKNINDYNNNNIKKKKKRKSKKKKECKELSNLQEAWTHLTDYGITLASLSTLGKIVEPVGHNLNSFRRTQCIVGHSSPPSCDSVPNHIDNLLHRIDDINLNPVTKSIEFHLDFLSIHPYDDGNGRSSRLVQNYILQSAGYSPCLVPIGEREHYIKTLRDAILDREHGKSHFHKPSENELLLRSYLSEKVLTTTKSLEKEINKQKIYEVVLNRNRDNPDFSFYRRFASIIRSYNNFTRGDQNITVTISSRDDLPKLRIEGDISRKGLDELLSRQTNRKKGSLRNYSITTVYGGKRK